MFTFRLGFIPLPYSHHVYLNGVEQREGVDWTDNGGGILSILDAMDTLSGDKLEVYYAHTADSSVFPGTTVVGFTSAIGFNAILTVPSGLQAGDLLIYASLSQGTGASSYNLPPTGFSTVTSGIAGGGRYGIFTKVAVGNETNVAVNASTGLDGFIPERVVSGLVVLRPAKIVGQTTTSGVSNPSVTPVVTLTGKEMAFFVGFMTSGVVSGNSGGVPTGYTEILSNSSGGGKQGLVMAYYNPGISGTSPSGGRNIGGNQWNDYVLVLG